MAIKGHEERFQKNLRVTLYVDQSTRDRSRFRIVKAVNSVNFPMGRKVSRGELQEFIRSGVEVVVMLRK